MHHLLIRVLCRSVVTQAYTTSDNNNGFNSTVLVTILVLWYTYVNCGNFDQFL